jgi:hypothetical protein
MNWVSRASNGLFESSAHDDRRLLVRLALACAVPILLAYGLAGIVYGHLAMLTPAGFLDMPGASAWLAAMAGFALTLTTGHWLMAKPVPSMPPGPRFTLTTHTIWRAPGQPLRQVQLRTALPPEPSRRMRTPSLQGILLLIAAVAALSALVGAAMQSMGMSAFTRPTIALAPRAEWLLWPLPHVWRWLLPLSRDYIVTALTLIGGGLIVISAFLETFKVRGAWVPVGIVVPILVAFASLGSAAYDFAVARGLGTLHDADMVQALAVDPGRHNAYTFISLWTAIACLTTVPILFGLFAKSMDGRSRGP